MTWSKFLTVTALFVGFVATFYWIKSTMQLSPKVISELSVTKWGYNLNILQSLSAQRAEAIIAFSLLIIVLLLQLISVLLPRDSMFSQSAYKGFVFSAAVVVLIVMISSRAAQYLFVKTENSAKSYIDLKIKE